MRAPDKSKAEKELPKELDDLINYPAWRLNFSQALKLARGLLDHGKDLGRSDGHKFIVMAKNVLNSTRLENIAPFNVEWNHAI